jgi:hypothetical protein
MLGRVKKVLGNVRGRMNKAKAQIQLLREVPEKVELSDDKSARAKKLLGGVMNTRGEKTVRRPVAAKTKAQPGFKVKRGQKHHTGHHG